VKKVIIFILFFIFYIQLAYAENIPSGALNSFSSKNISIVKDSNNKDDIGSIIIYYRNYNVDSGSYLLCYIFDPHKKEMRVIY
jgi:hypothetical protein